MNIALIKLGARVSVNSSATSGGTGETISIIKLLLLSNCKVDVYTKVLESDIMPDDFNILDIESEYNSINNKNYDCLVVLNGNVNYFGGQDSAAQTLNYNIINNFKGRVFYIMCDCNLLLKQIWPSIEKKKWSSNYNKEDIYIKRNDIVYISQAQFVHKVKQKAINQGIDICDVVYFPFEKFPLVTMKDFDFNDNPKYDLLYGGTFRGGSREDDMIKFYFGYDNKYNVSMFGKIEINNFNENKISNLRKPDFEKSVSYNEFGNKMLESKATVVIGDKLYKQWGDLAQRIYESIKVGNIVLIDNSYDFRKVVFKNNKELIDFCYVNDRKDVENRLDKLVDNDYRKYLLTLQRDCVNIDINEYCNSLISIVKRYI